jgi:hypothetical protein
MLEKDVVAVVVPSNELVGVAPWVLTNVDVVATESKDSFCGRRERPIDVVAAESKDSFGGKFERTVDVVLSILTLERL